MTLYDFTLVLCLFLIITLLIKHLNISRRAKITVREYTEKHQVQLLDQSVVLISIRLARSSASLLTLERQYRFEFSTLGDQRYQGFITYRGSKRKHIELEPYKVLEEEPGNLE